MLRGGIGSAKSGRYLVRRSQYPTTVPVQTSYVCSLFSVMSRSRRINLSSIFSLIITVLSMCAQQPLGPGHGNTPISLSRLHCTEQRSRIEETQQHQALTRAPPQRVLSSFPGSVFAVDAHRFLFPILRYHAGVNVTDAFGLPANAVVVLRTVSERGSEVVCCLVS